MATLEDLMREYRQNRELVDLASSEDKTVKTRKTREEAATGIEALKSMMGQAETELGTREKALGSLMDAAKAKPDRDLLAEALLAFAPALAGYGLGRAAGGVGMAETGIAAGAQAGLAGLERLEKGREEEKKLAAEKLKLRPEYKAYETAAEKAKLLQKSYYDALGAGKKVTETGTQEAATTREKQEQFKPLKPIVPPSVKLQPHHKKMVDKFSESYANQTGTAIALETLLQQISDPKIPKDLAIQAGLDSLKILNSIEGRDAVGVEEANRVGRFLQFNIIPNLTRPGPAFGRSMDLFKKQVENAAQRARTRAASTQKEIEKIMGQYGDGANAMPAPSAVAAPKASRSAADIQKEIDELEKGRK